MVDEKQLFCTVVKATSCKSISAFWKGSLPHQTRIFSALDGKLVDLNLAYAAYLAQSGDRSTAYERAAFYFPETIGAVSHARRAIFAGAGRSRFVRAQNRRARSARSRRREGCLRPNGSPNTAAASKSRKKLRHRLFRPGARRGHAQGGNPDGLLQTAADFRHERRADHLAEIF